MRSKGAQARELKQGSSSKRAKARELKQESSSKGAQARELKQGSSSKGALAREQAGKKAGKQASTWKAFSQSHALEGLVVLKKTQTDSMSNILCQF